MMRQLPKCDSYLSMIGDPQNATQVFRDSIRENRDNYYVVYEPADSRSYPANLLLTFPQHGIESDEIARLMELELKRWLQRYAVPVIVSAVDHKGNSVRIPSKGDEVLLFGYIASGSNEVVCMWGRGEGKIPEARPNLETVYADVPFRLKKDVEQIANSEWQKRVRGMRFVTWTIFVFGVLIPLAIELVSIGVPWLGNVMQAGSIFFGFYKIIKWFGWPKSSIAKEVKAEKERKMRHYYYHCERNPEGFNRLKRENSESDEAQRIQSEFAEIRALNGNP